MSITIITKSLKKDPNNLDALEIKGLALYKLKNEEEK
jgi:hypothetical protein